MAKRQEKSFNSRIQRLFCRQAQRNGGGGMMGLLNSNIGIGLIAIWKSNKNFLYKKKIAIKYFSQMSLFSADVIAHSLTLESPLK